MRGAGVGFGLFGFIRVPIRKFVVGRVGRIDRQVHLAGIAARLSALSVYATLTHAVHEKAPPCFLRIAA